MKVLEGLNEAQREAVMHVEGPCLVVAGAGTGKTRVLTRRIAALVEQGISTGTILAITFTNRAAREMRERITRLIPDFSGGWIKTFHAACHRILRQEIHHLGYNRDFTVVDELEQKAIIKECLQSLGEYEEKPEVLGSSFKKAKNSLRAEQYLKNLKLPQDKIELYSRVFDLYNARLKHLNALDFEDLIVLCIQIFQENDEILAKYQERFQYIMIDEYQDTNYSQYIWAKLLSEKYQNIFIVGDPDQSIYSWRGAEPENINRFLRDYPEAKVITLETNYRSTQYILDAANAVIRNNVDRAEKNLVTNNPDGEKLVRFQSGDSIQEAEFIAGTIRRLVQEKGYRYRDIAVFYRTHAQSRYLEDVFTRTFVPYHIVGAHGFYERKEVRDLLGYLKLAVNPADLISFRRVVNFPRRGVGEVTLGRIENYAEENDLPILEAVAEPDKIAGVSKKAVNALEEFYALLKHLKKLGEEGPMADVIEVAMVQSGYIDEMHKRAPLDADEKISFLQEFKSVAMEFDRLNGGNLGDFLSEVALTQNADDMDHDDQVTLMTLHSAKGLEFPVVFMTGMEEGVFPSTHTETEAEMEEERRLCYVGMTRAREKLYFTSALSRILYGHEMKNLPCRFLNEIPEKLFAPEPPSPKKRADRRFRKAMEKRTEPLKLIVGDKVEHRKFGRGIVSEVVEADIAVVDFELAGTKMLKTDIAPLIKLE